MIYSPGDDGVRSLDAWVDDDPDLRILLEAIGAMVGYTFDDADWAAFEYGDFRRAYYPDNWFHYPVGDVQISVARDHYNGVYRVRRAGGRPDLDRPLRAIAAVLQNYCVQRCPNRSVGRLLEEPPDLTHVDMDGSQIASFDDALRMLDKTLDLNLGSLNLSALWDRMYRDLPRPSHMVWRRAAMSRAAVGDADFDRIIAILDRTVAADSERLPQDRFTYELDEST